MNILDAAWTYMVNHQSKLINKINTKMKELLKMVLEISS